MISPKKRAGLAIILTVGCLLCSCTHTDTTYSLLQIQALEDGFKSPPNAAKPRVWWHWLNGNITRDGIRKDLDWMQQSGLGGLQNFDINLAIPTVVEKPAQYMSDEWKELYQYSVNYANELGLEFAIAASPGWSETGGPWVEPKDGMKKIVWKETLIEGRFNGILEKPPSTTGPFQDLSPPKELNPTPKTSTSAHYEDIAILAYQVETPTAHDQPDLTLGNGAVIPNATLTDGLFSTGIKIPATTEKLSTTVNVDYKAPQTIRSLTLYISDIADIYSGASVSATLEAKTSDNVWQMISDITLSTVPTTVSFPSVTAQSFRIIFKPVANKRSNESHSAPGFDMSYMRAIAAMMGTDDSMELRELSLSPNARIHQFEVKAGFSIAENYYNFEVNSENIRNTISPGKVINLTDKLASDGLLNWSPPAGSGQWKILRIGYSLLGKKNHPAVEEATGLEVDKLDARAVRDYIETYLNYYSDAVGSELIGEKGITALLTDSTEVGPFNWTPELLTHFEKLRGYDPLPWLPTVTGEIIGSRAESDKFLYDFRRTIAELHATEHYRTIAKVAEEKSLTLYGESLEGWRPSLGDDMEMRRYATYPMAAMWSYRREDGPKSLYLGDMRGAASVAHIYGQNIAAAESLTSTRYPWDHVPADLRRVIDLEFAHGINRIIIHSSVHQPLDDNQPGLSMRHIGQFFNRHTAWSGMTRPWIDYIARSSYLLQQGRFFADVAYFYGEEAPLGALTWDNYFNDVPKHYAYDFVSPNAVLEALRVENGKLVSASGASYQLLYLGGSSSRMTLSMLRRIEELVSDGATIVGNAPGGSPSLDDDQVEYTKLVRKLWSGKTTTIVGKGKVFAEISIEAALKSMGIFPDVELVNQKQSVNIPFVHRHLEAGEIYYLNNRNNHKEKVIAKFRVTGKKPEIWNATNASMEPVSYRIENGQTIVPLNFNAEESYFVVFVEPTTELEHHIPERQLSTVATINGKWDVVFESGRGAPMGVLPMNLASLSDHSEPGIRYFSGVSTYSIGFDAPEGFQPGMPLHLDLGEVGDLAEVWVNGNRVDILWHPPYRVDIGAYTRPHENSLEIRVANRWVNRLIGDAQPGAEKISFTVTPTYRANAPLRPSGLIGPVRLMLVK